MAVRFSADGQDYTRSLALGAQTAHTVCGWFKISTDRNDYSTLWSLDNGTGDMELIQTDSDGTTLGAYLDYDAGNIVAMTAGVWYFVAVVAATTGNGRTAYYKVEGANALTSVSLGNGSSTNVATLRIGESPFGAEYLNGCAAAVKMWSGQSLTQAELELESNQYQPVRTANLTFYYPFVNAGTTDYSGNAQTLSGGSGTATEAGPSIRWDRRAVPKLFLPPPAGGPGSITGVAAAPLGGLAATATGTKNVGGTASAPLGTLSASASGTPKVTGTAAAPLGALTASATGTPKVLATAAAPLGALVGIVTATRATSGSAAAVLGALTATATGTRSFTGTAAAVLGSLTATATGTRSFSGSAAALLGSLTASASGAVSHSGIATAALGELVAAVTGTRSTTGSAAAPLGGLTGLAIGVGDVFADAPLGSLVAAATGTVKVTGTATAALGSLVAAATGTRKVTGTAAASLGSLTAAVTGTPKVIAAATAALGALSASATGGVAGIVTAAASLGTLTAGASGVVKKFGIAGATLGALHAVVAATPVVDLVRRKMPRVQAVILPVLRERIPGVTFTTWVPDVDYRDYPLVNIRRLGGLPIDVRRLDRAVVEITAYSRDGIIAAEDLYLDVRTVVWDMVQEQIVIPEVGHLCSYFETFGPTSFDSPFEDTWRVQGLIQLGIRPPRDL